MSQETAFNKVYEFGITEIEDVRLTELLNNNPALFLRTAWDYLRNAIPLFSSPSGIQAKLTDYAEPIFGDANFTGDGTTTVFNTGALNSEIVVVSVDGEVVSIIETEDSTSQGGVSYDAETGNITFDVAPANGADIDVDTYTDGYFNSELNQTELSILGLCFRIVWFSKLSNTYLRITPKLKDKNFKIDSSWGTQNADTGRVHELRMILVDEMASYEQSLAYSKTVPQAKHLV